MCYHTDSQGHIIMIHKLLSSHQNSLHSRYFRIFHYALKNALFSSTHTHTHIYVYILLYKTVHYMALKLFWPHTSV
jgi:galactose-1-phosphate uridylyltransferase